VPIVGNVIGPIHASEHSKNLESRIKNEVKEKLPEVVNKLIANATKDLEKQKKEVLIKMDAVITNREKEVVEAKKTINALETVNQELVHKNKDLRDKLGREKEQAKENIRNLQEGIKELNKQLKEYREKEVNAQNFLNKQRAEKAKKVMDNINSPIQDPQVKIKALQDLVNQLEFNLKFAEDSRDQRAKELKDEQNSHARTKQEHETTKNNAEKDLEAKENELKRERQIFLDQQKQLNEEIRG
jgi:DNA repair exonuclease SbcCD ATPase subunit